MMESNIDEKNTEVKEAKIISSFNGSAYGGFDEAFRNMMKSSGCTAVLVLAHVNPDGDAAGSVMSIAHYLRVKYPEFTIIPYIGSNIDKGPKLMLDEDPYFRPFEKPEMQIRNSMGGVLSGRDLHNEGAALSGDGVTELKPGSFAVISCDTSTEERVCGHEYFENAAASIAIDHHENSELFADANYVRIGEANCENIYYAIGYENLKNAVEIEKKSYNGPCAADYLYLGIMHDTETFSRTTVALLEAAEGLLKLGVVQAKLMRTVNTKTLADLRKQGYLLSLTKRACGDDCAYIMVSSETAKKYDITYEDIHPLSGILRDCEDVRIGFSMFEDEPGHWRLSFRSDGKWINLNDLLSPFGGGGHDAAAGLKKWTDEPEKLINDIIDRIVQMRKNMQ